VDFFANCNDMLTCLFQTGGDRVGAVTQAVILATWEVKIGKITEAHPDREV
jgi:hypothetical protein